MGIFHRIRTSLSWNFIKSFSLSLPAPTITPFCLLNASSYFSLYSLFSLTFFHAVCDFRQTRRSMCVCMWGRWDTNSHAILLFRISSFHSPFVKISGYGTSYIFTVHTVPFFLWQCAQALFRRGSPRTTNFIRRAESRLLYELKGSQMYTSSSCFSNLLNYTISFFLFFFFSSLCVKNVVVFFVRLVQFIEEKRRVGNMQQLARYFEG